MDALSRAYCSYIFMYVIIVHLITHHAHLSLITINATMILHESYLDEIQFQ